jgi:hypothetical protein
VLVVIVSTHVKKTNVQDLTLTFNSRSFLGPVKTGNSIKILFSRTTNARIERKAVS